MRMVRVLGIVLLASGALRAEGSAILLRPPDARALRALESLRAQSETAIDARWDLATGRARSLEGLFPLEGDLPQACLAFLRRNAALFGWDESINLRLASTHRGLGTEHLRFDAFLGGVPVAGNWAHFHIRKSGGPARLIFVDARLVPVEAPPAPPLVTASAAASLAESRVGSPRRLRTPTTARLAYSPLPAPGGLVHDVTVDSLEPRGLFLVRVDARTGEVLGLADRLRYAPAGKTGSGKVFELSPPVALHDPSLEDHDDAADAVPAEAYTTAPLLDLDGSGVLRGPYVSTVGTPHAVRRVSLNFNLLRDADGFEEVMIYHHVDSAQRALQSLGFTDVCVYAIPAFANSEPPGVPYTDVQAYYLPDLENPGKGQLAFGSGGVDLAEDPEVILHEYGHAIQDCQVPGWGNDIDAVDAMAMGEGWADFHGAAQLAPLTGGYGDLCLGEWASLGITENRGPEGLNCVRRLDSLKHYPEDLEGEPHEDGEMWSACLWQIFEGIGREDSLRLILQSHLFDGPSATFAEAAESVLRADREVFGGAQQDFLRGIFTDRGFFQEPPDLTWFYVAKLASPKRFPDDGPLVMKLRLSRAGAIPLGPRPVEVYVDLQTPDASSLDISLRSPSGTTVRLQSSGFRTIPSGKVIFGSRVEPVEPLDLLAGEPTSGIWSLEIFNFSFSEGSLADWGLRFQGFVRGDANRDGQLNVTDAVVILEHLFRGGTLACRKAGDVNDDGEIDIADAVRLLFHLVGLGPTPVQPYPDAGEDLTPDELTCEG